MKLHRSLVFWAGAVVMASLSWGWWDSTRNLLVGSSKDIVVLSAGSGITVARWRGIGTVFERDTLDGDAASLREVGLRAPMLLIDEGGDWKERTAMKSVAGPKPDPLRHLISNTVMSAGGWMCYVPYWLITSMAAGVWGALLVWRWRRIRGAAAVVMVEGGEG